MNTIHSREITNVRGTGLSHAHSDFHPVVRPKILYQITIAHRGSVGTPEGTDAVEGRYLM